MSTQLEQAFELLEKIEATSKRNEKEALLKSGAENTAFKKLLFYAYNAYFMYNLRDFGAVSATSTDGVSEDRFTAFLRLLDSLRQREVTGNEAIERTKTFFETLNSLEFKWYSRVLLKDLKAGITEKTINKAIPGLIPVFECMLAKPWEDVKKKPEQVVVEPKLDGYRCLAFVYEDGEVALVTRNGKPIEGFKEIESDLAELPKGFVYDGEITGKKSHFTDMQELVFKKSEFKEGILNIFDFLPISEFHEGKSGLKLSVRKKLLTNLFEEAKKSSYIPSLALVSFSEPLSPDDPKIDALYNEYLEQGYEGIMLKDTESFYYCKRSPAWAKLKPDETFDLEIVDFEEGTDRFTGMLGAFVVDFEGYRVNVGSGFTEAQRKDFWARREELLGRIIEVKAQQVSSNKKGEKSLRFPVFQRIREDK